MAHPALAVRFDLQPDIAAAFWSWKQLNRFADANDFEGCVRAWNGGLNGLADRQRRLAAWRALLAEEGVEERRAPLLVTGGVAAVMAVVRGLWGVIAGRRT